MPRASAGCSPEPCGYSADGGQRRSDGTGPGRRGSPPSAPGDRAPASELARRAHRRRTRGVLDEGPHVSRPEDSVPRPCRERTVPITVRRNIAAQVKEHPVGRRDRRPRDDGALLATGSQTASMTQVFDGEDDPQMDEWRRSIRVRLSKEARVTDDVTELIDPQFWRMPLEDRMARFAELREVDAFLPASFDNPMSGLTEAFSVTTRFAELVDISRRPEDFCSGRGAVSIPDLPAEALEFFGSFINMDDPRHARQRGIVSRSFTPRQLASVLESVETICAEVIDGMCEQGEVDLVAALSQPFPLLVICDMMGIPRASSGRCSKRRTSSSAPATPTCSAVAIR